MNDPQKSLSYKQVRGRGGFIRSNWPELNQLIAAANVWTIKTYGPDRVAGFADPGDVDGFLRRRNTLSVTIRWHLFKLLRLVLRPAARLADDLGRANRRTGICRLV